MDGQQKQFKLQIKRSLSQRTSVSWTSFCIFLCTSLSKRCATLNGGECRFTKILWKKWDKNWTSVNWWKNWLFMTGLSMFYLTKDSWNFCTCSRSLISRKWEMKETCFKWEKTLWQIYLEWYLKTQKMLNKIRKTYRKRVYRK